MKRRSVLQGMSAGIGALLLSPIGASAQVTPGQTVDTQYGKVRGFVDQGIHGFKGIPYGDDTAKTRFAAPRGGLGPDPGRGAL